MRRFIASGRAEKIEQNREVIKLKADLEDIRMTEILPLKVRAARLKADLEDARMTEAPALKEDVRRLTAEVEKVKTSPNTTDWQLSE